MSKDNATLEARIRDLERKLESLTGQPAQISIAPEDRPDYIPHGSELHAAYLGLRRATEADAKEDQVDGWALQDLTAFGVTADPHILHAILTQKVNELKGPPKPQDQDQTAPNYAPPMWLPQGMRVAGIVGGT